LKIKNQIKFVIVFQLTCIFIIFVLIHFVSDNILVASKTKTMKCLWCKIM